MHTCQKVLTRRVAVYPRTLNAVTSRTYRSRILLYKYIILYQHSRVRFRYAYIYYIILPKFVRFFFSLYFSKLTRTTHTHTHFVGSAIILYLSIIYIYIRQTYIIIIPYITRALYTKNRTF